MNSAAHCPDAVPRVRPGAHWVMWLGLVALGAAIGADPSPPSSRPGIQPGIAAGGGRAGSGAALARLMLARCRKARTVQARLEGAAVWEGESMSSSIRLLFQRQAGPAAAGAPARGSARVRQGRAQRAPSRAEKLQPDPLLRLDLKAFNTDSWAVFHARRYVQWFPEQRHVMRGELPEMPAWRWDGFANPLMSLLALFWPTDEDQDAIEKAFVSRIQLLPPETDPELSASGEPLARLRGRGAYGALVDFWLDACDNAPRRIVLRAPARGDAAQYRIELAPLDRALDPRAFEVRIPRNAHDPARDAAGAADGGDPGREEDPAAGLKRLQARAARAPHDSSLQLQLASAAMEMGEAAQAVAALSRIRPEELPAHDAVRAWQLAAEGVPACGSRSKLAASLLIAGVRQHGEAALGLQDLEGLDFTTLGAASDSAAEVAAAVEAILPRAKRPWLLRARLIALCKRGNADEPLVRNLLALLDGGGEKGYEAERQEAIALGLNDLAQSSWSVPAQRREAILAALRRAERRLPPADRDPDGLLAHFPGLYLAVDSLPDAARMLQLMGSSLGVDLGTTLQIAVGLKRAGDGATADHLLRELLQGALAEDSVDYATVAGLLAVPDGRGILAPVLRQLAEADRQEDPFAAASWLYLAGDHRQAAAAYEAYLASPAGSPEAVGASPRYASAVLGSLCAREVGDTARLERLARVATEEIPFAELEMESQQTLAAPLLSAVSGSPAIGPVLEALASHCPQAAWIWMNQQGDELADAVGALDGATLRKVLELVLARMAQTGQGEGDLASWMFRLGRPGEAMEALVARLRSEPLSVNLRQVEHVAVWVQDPAPLVTALREAVRKNPSWRAGLLSMASCELAQDVDPAAVRDLSAAAAQMRFPELYRRLARVLWRRGRRDDAVSLLREGIAALRVGSRGRVAPAPDLQSLLAEMLSAGGSTAESLAIWRELAKRSVGAPPLEVFYGLWQCGAAGDGVRCLESAVRPGAAGAGAGGRARLLSSRAPGRPRTGHDGREKLRVVLAAAYLEAGPGGAGPEKALALFPALARHVRAADFDPELRGGERSGAIVLVARALDRLGERAAARRAYAVAVLQHAAAATDYERFVRLAIEDREIEEARDLISRSLQDTPYARILIHNIPGLELQGAHRVALAALDNAGSRLSEERFAALLEQVVHPDGDPFPHVSPAAELACRLLADQARRRDDRETETRCRRWSEGMRLGAAAAVLGADRPLAAISLARAAALLPGSPCVTLAPLLRNEPDPNHEWQAGLARLAHPPDLATLRRAADELLAVPGGALGCPTCAVFLRSPGGALAHFLRDDRAWSASHAGSARAHLLLGISALPAGAPTGAARARSERALRQALALEPRLPLAWRLLGNMYAESPGLVGAWVEAAEELVALRPEDPSAHAAAAEAYQAAGRRSEAEAHRRQARQLDSALARWATFYSLAGQERFDRFLNSDPLVQIASFLDQRGPMAARWVTPEFPGLTPLAVGQDCCP